MDSGTSSGHLKLSRWHQLAQEPQRSSAVSHPRIWFPLNKSWSRTVYEAFSFKGETKTKKPSKFYCFGG